MPSAMQNHSAVGLASPPSSPNRPLSFQQYPRHSKQQSLASLAAAHRAKPSLSRFGDGITSRSSEDESTRTAVKVAVRVRPALKPSDPGYDLIPQRFRQSTCDIPTSSSLSVQSPQGKKLFVFDRVFGEETSQDGIWDYLSESVSSFVKGYNVSILAYGQSGSGKSYTMGTSGPEDQSDQHIMGIVPRAAHTLFEKLNGGSSGSPKRQSGLPTPKSYSSQALPTLGGLAAKGGDGSEGWSLKATYVEIYQEQLRDLLVSEDIPMQDRPQVAIREDPKGRILVTGLKQVPIKSVEDLLNALSFGSAIRQTDATNVNARSSRSHAVFSLNLVQKKPESSAATTPKAEKRMSMSLDGPNIADNLVTIDSKLHFVDLAGSERLKNTGATGDRAREGISINAGLASLGKVISQLSTKHANAHISYRDSRLTRLLQDSLGGNAITFMIACVTPAVFHLSETLNTVHYAQRARAIQSKPEIQQTREEGDKQAAIDRLRAEVSFLRDQIRHSEHTSSAIGGGAGKGDGGSRGGPDRAFGPREADLQQELMDMQENYNALSQRHARLMADLSQAKGPGDGDGGGSSSTGTATPSTIGGENIGEAAMDRIARSSSFAEAVEQMVLEYEKTIQSLETSLSKTRSSLSQSESDLLEKETQIAYMETLQHQLNARIQKAHDREHNNETYLRDLETRMEDATGGEEKHATLVAELRRELTRVRESESNAEEYISTLEERLADAEKDQETMQREIDRLEHVVERQRSIGRLDNLLGELDGIQGQGQGQRGGQDDRDDEAVPLEASTDELDATPMNSTAPSVSAQVNGNNNRESYDPFRPSTADTTSSRYSTEGTPAAQPAGLFSSSSRGIDAVPDPSATPAPGAASNVAPPSAATVLNDTQQSDFMADKLESLTQELFDLRSDHESVVSDYDKLQQKYRTALETLARMEYEKEGDVQARSEEDEEESTISGAPSDEAFLAGAQSEVPGERTDDEEVKDIPLSSSALPRSSSPSSLPLRDTSSLEALTSKVDDAVDADTVEAVEEADDAATVALPGEVGGDASLAEEKEESRDIVAPAERTDGLEAATVTRGAIEKSAGPSQLVESSVESDLQELRELHAQNAILAQKEIALTELTSTYNDLLAKHEATLAQLDDLKHAQSPRLSTFRPSSQGFNKSLFRRKSEDLLGNMDARASRSLAALRTLASDTFDTLNTDTTDMRASFDLNINAIMAELQARAERVWALEAEMSTTKKELDAKQTIISGLTRERSSLKAASTVDFSVVGQMQNQLRESENQIRALQKMHDSREKELKKQIATLKDSVATTNSLPTPVDDVKSDLPLPGDFPQPPGAAGKVGDESARGLSAGGADAEVVTKLQGELDAWESKHRSALQSMQDTETKLLETIAGLESSLRAAQASNAASSVAGAEDRGLTPTASAGQGLFASAGAAADEAKSTGAVAPLASQTSEGAAALASLEQERQKHRDVVDALQREVENYKASAHSHVQKLEQLEESYEEVVRRLETDSQSRELDSQQLSDHRDLVLTLENQLVAHKSAIALHQQGLEELQSAHANDMDALHASMAAAEQASVARYAELEQLHTESSRDLQSRLDDAQRSHEDLLQSASAVLGCSPETGSVHMHIQRVVDDGAALHARHRQSAVELNSVREELSSALTANASLEGKVGELRSINDEVVRKLEKAAEREKKNSRLIDELEEQLNSNFDEHKAASNRLSLMQDEVAMQRIELERELEEQKLRNSMLEQQMAILQRESGISTNSYNRESLSPEAAAIALARSSSSSSTHGQANYNNSNSNNASNNTTSQTRKSSVPTALPTPPPSIPLPPLPSSPTSGGHPVLHALDTYTGQTAMPTHYQPNQYNVSPPGSRHMSKDSATGTSNSNTTNNTSTTNATTVTNNTTTTSPQQLEEQEARIRTIEKHLFAEKQLTATLEEALVDLETSANRTKSEMESWRRKCGSLEDELVGLRKEKSTNRASLQAVEEEREMRMRAERARQALEQRMNELAASSGGKKKKNALNCFN